MTNVTFDEYKSLMKKMLKMNVSVYIGSEINAFEDVVEKIEAIEEAHPEYEEML